jgi:uncharacterized protein (DUF433 family)
MDKDATITPTTHPYIHRLSDIANGKPILVGSRIKVTQIALEYEQLGWTPDQIIDAHPHLTLAKVHDALSYYYENQAELDAILKEEEEFAEEMSRIYPSKLTSRHAR